MKTLFAWYPNDTLGEAKDLQNSHVPLSRSIHQRRHWWIHVLAMPKGFPNKIGDG